MKKKCKKCESEIPSKIEINGKIRNLQNRKYCLECSPFGQHNTKQLSKPKKQKQICVSCQQEKKITEFYKKGNTGGSHSYCKECFNAYCIERWQNKKKEAVEAKGGKCIICGYRKNYAAFDFHHREGEEKEMQWNKMRLASQDKIDEELAKCDLLCKNCHTELHNPQAEIPDF